MADQILREDLLDKLREFARREQRPVDAVLESMIEQYTPQPAPAAPEGEDDDPVFQAQYREFRRKVYQIGRDYRQKVGNTERLALTDEQLDEQFWLIDHECWQSCGSIGTQDSTTPIRQSWRCRNG